MPRFLCWAVAVNAELPRVSKSRVSRETCNRKKILILLNFLFFKSDNYDFFFIFEFVQKSFDSNFVPAFRKSCFNLHEEYSCNYERRARFGAVFEILSEMQAVRFII